MLWLKGKQSVQTEQTQKKREEEDMRQAETNRRGRELKEAWRKHHPKRDKPPDRRGEGPV